MERFAVSVSDNRRLKGSSGIPAIAFFSGLVLGASVPGQADGPLLAMMRMMPGGAVSIADLLLVRLLPLLLAGLAVYTGWCGLLVPVAFGKAFLSAFWGMSLQLAFGGSGWLVRWLFSFSELLSLPVLCFLFHRLPGAEREEAMGQLWLAGLFIVGLTCLDFFVILPFGVGLLS